MQAILECHEEKKQELQKAFTTKRIRGLPYMTSATFWGSFDPLPLVSVVNQFIVFLSSAFWGPLPQQLWTSHMDAPLAIFPPIIIRALISFLSAPSSSLDLRSSF